MRGGDQGQQKSSTGFPIHRTLRAHRSPGFSSLPHSGTIPPIKSAQGEGDDVKKLFTIGCPVILATLGVALLFVVRKKRKEKRLKRLRGGGGGFSKSFLGERAVTSSITALPWTTDPPGQETAAPVFPEGKTCHSNLTYV